MLLWDLYNEPGNSGMGNRSLPLVEATFGWARQADPSQPLSMGIWIDSLSDLNRVMIEQSDVVTYHAHRDTPGMTGAVGRYPFGHADSRGGNVLVR